MTDDDGRSMISMQSESGVHASQMGLPSATVTGEGAQDGGQQASKARKSKLQLWNELKISGRLRTDFETKDFTKNYHSHHTSLYPDIHTSPSHTAHSCATQPAWAPKLLIKRRNACGRLPE